MSWRKEIPLGGNSFPSVQLSAGEQWAPYSQNLNRVGRARPVFSIEESTAGGAAAEWQGGGGGEEGGGGGEEGGGGGGGTGLVALGGATSVREAVRGGGSSCVS